MSSSNSRRPDPGTRLGLLLALALLLAAAGVALGGGGPVNNEELYKMLGVSKKSTTKEIRIAFKKLALEKHPDKNKVTTKKTSPSPHDLLKIPPL